MEKFLWWNESQCKLADDAKNFVDSIMPAAMKCAWKRQYPWKILDKIKGKGWFGAMIPEEYGGRAKEWGVTGACIILEEMGRTAEAHRAYGTTLIGSTTQILHNGSEEQKRRWLPKLAKGELLGAITITEPYTGSDAAGIETAAKLDGGVYVVNGKKRFITNAGAANLYVTYVKTDESPEARAKSRHLTALVLEKGMPGFTVERVNDLLGFDGIYNGYLNFENVRVPVANRLEDEGDGWKVMTGGLNVERTIGASFVLGMMREALRWAVFHMQRRIQFGQPSINIATNQAKVANMILQLKLARLSTFYTAYLLELGKDAPVEASSSKVFNSDNGIQFIIEAVQCMGGDGATKFYPVERLMRDVKIAQIAAGTSEVQRLIIFRQGLRSMAEDLKVPRRVMDEELGVPMPAGGVLPLKKVGSEEDVLKALAENYRVNPGLNMTLQDMMEQLEVKPEKLNEYLVSLEKQGLARVHRDRKGLIDLCRATYAGLAKANPPEYYRYIPDWVAPEDMF